MLFSRSIYVRKLFLSYIFIGFFLWFLYYHKYFQLSSWGRLRPCLRYINNLPKQKWSIKRWNNKTLNRSLTEWKQGSEIQQKRMENTPFHWPIEETTTNIYVIERIFWKKMNEIGDNYYSKAKEFIVKYKAQLKIALKILM